ncbi:hypothetical protein XA68_11494 [Ophiocordyceps unilateralis]|uniref:Uncharacterized protein n=1 Tax=Ophiocordyceps unilateralis TaxID=268505 RepID=A0A2A9PGX0_OPHUN|nr:hypothetical protein XA68_11494 [Ophiocordyceps unilateralis]
MTLNLPDVERVQLSLTPQQDVGSAATDVSNDHGTPNMLLLAYTDLVPIDSATDLNSMREDFQTWNAWELGQAEVQVDGHVKAGDLPADDSIVSRIARTNFRSKAIEFFRATSQAWLVPTDNFTVKRPVEATEASANGAISSELQSLVKESQLQDQFGVGLHTIKDRVDVKTENKYFFTHLVYQYNRSSKTIRPVVRDISFIVKKAGEKKSGNKVAVEIAFTAMTYDFDLTFWRGNRHKGAAAIKKGEPIRKQMSFDFLNFE